MKLFPPFIPWLALMALADWLIMRTITRMAIFMPKSAPLIIAYQGLTFIGQLVATLSSLLALFVISWSAWAYARSRYQVGLSFILIGLVSLSLLSLFVILSSLAAIVYHLLLLTVVALAIYRLQRSSMHRTQRIAGILSALALIAGRLYQIGPTVYEAMQWSGPAPFSHIFFHLGEFLVVISTFALWAAYGRHASRRIWLGAILGAVGFLFIYFTNPAMTGIIAIWSIGLTLYLPWPIYALAIMLTCVTVSVTFRRGDPAGWAIVLLAAGGYAPQLSTHAFLGLIALWLLIPVNPMHQSEPIAKPQESRIEPAQLTL